MEETANIFEKGNALVRSMHPKKFAMWLFIISVTMLFAALTSAYIVKKSGGNWLVIDFPFLFNVTSVVIILSSISMHFAYMAAKRDNLFNIRLGLIVTGILAMVFVIGQYLAWDKLVEQDVYFVGNPAGSFIYVFTGLHVLHLVGGLVFLGIVLAKAYQYRVHSKSMTALEMCTTYWHFLGGLWLYLYIFLIANN